jgi:hypothetical protein
VAHVVKPVNPFATLFVVVHVTAPVVGLQEVEPAPATLVAPVLLIVTAPVAPDTPIPVPATLLVTPVLEHETAPVVGEHETPDVPATDETVFVPVHVTAPVVGEQFTVPAPVTLETPATSVLAIVMSACPVVALSTIVVVIPVPSIKLSVR